MRRNLADQVFCRHHEAIKASLLQLADVPRGDAPTFFHQHLIPDADVEAGQFAAQAFGHQIEHDLIARQTKDVVIEEDLQHLPRLHAQRPQQDGHRQLAAAVDAGVEQVLGIEFEIEPRSPIRDDAGGVQNFTGRMRLAAIVIEENPRRAMHLRDDNPFRAIDHEGAVLGHERQFAHVHFLFLDLLGEPVGSGAVLVEQDQPHLDPQRRRIGDAALLTLLDVEGRLAEAVVDILQTRVAGITLDRKDGIQRRMNPPILAPGRRHIELQEIAIGIELDRQQIRHVLHRRQLGEVLAKALFFGERVRHGVIPRRLYRPAGKPAYP